MKVKINLRLKILIPLISFAVCPYFAFSQQQKDDLIRKKDYLEKSIEYASLLIDDAIQLKQATFDDLLLLQSKIDSRESLIESLNNEQTLLTDTILMSLLQIDKLGLMLDDLKNEYAKMIRSAYVNQNTSQRMLYVLASGSFNQAYRRLNYYRHYAEKRSQQIERIKTAETVYVSKIGQLEARLKRNQQLLQNVNSEYATLENEILLKSNIIGSLSERVNKLIAEQKQNVKASLELENRIEEAVYNGSGNSKSKEGSLNLLTPEEHLISADFTDNRGKLPWPLERGIISSFFGEHNHPELERVKIKNNGINILTQEGATARAVFDGEVTRILSVPNFNTVVIVRHGNYLTVYSNLSTVFVKPGSKIKTKQEIGTIFTNKDEAKTELHFEMWEGKTLLDPTEWITSGRENNMVRYISP